MQAQHFAVHKIHIPEGCTRQFNEAQIAIYEFTICENEIGKIAFGKVAVTEPAVLVLTFC